MKTVAYAGYELRVPANWPVYQLDENPLTCVRYDVHAVYLGTPGASEQCPAGLVGRTETVSIIPGAAAAAGARQVVQNAEQHQLRMTLNAGAGGQPATVIATYGGSPAAVEQMLASLRTVRGVVPQSAPASPTASASRTASPPPTASPPTASPSPSPSAPQPSPSPRSTGNAGPVLGFDTCAAPPLATMKAWRSAYAAVGIYVGGVNAACPYGNLSSSWIRSAAAMGWGMMPVYVGPQAPCYTGAVTIDPNSAAAEGQAAGDDAVGDAQQLGLPAGSPIYYDMEAYDNQEQSCTTAVLTFLGAWDREVTARGYVTGVYSSEDSGIADMESAAVAKQPGFTVPQAIWIAQWDNVASLDDGTLVWPLTERNKQYQAPHNQTVGGITLNIDGDLAGGPLAT